METIAYNSDNGRNIPADPFHRPFEFRESLRYLERMIPWALLLIQAALSNLRTVPLFMRTENVSPGLGELGTWPSFSMMTDLEQRREVSV